MYTYVDAACFSIHWLDIILGILISSCPGYIRIRGLCHILFQPAMIKEVSLDHVLPVYIPTSVKPCSQYYMYCTCTLGPGYVCY